MKKLILVFSLLCLFLFAPYFAQACSINGIDSNGTGLGSGPGNVLFAQTFVACETGVVTSVSFRNHTNGTAGTNNFKIGTSTNPPSSLLGGGVYQTFASNGGGETITITLSTPFAVTSGSVYVFEVQSTTNSLNLAAVSTSDYADGSLYFDNGGGFNALSNSYDLDFSVEISSVDVPTLSQWGLIILALLLMTLGTLYLVQPNLQQRFEQSLPLDLGE